MEKQRLQVSCMVILDTFCRQAGIGPWELQNKRYPQMSRQYKREYRISHLARRNTPTDTKTIIFLDSLHGRPEQCSEQNENATSLFQSSTAKKQHKVIISIPFGRHDKASVRGRSQVVTPSSMPPGYEKMTMWCKEQRTRIQSGRVVVSYNKITQKAVANC